MRENIAQPSFSDLEPYLSQVTFCVLDLETTGIGDNAEITEIGAIKVQGGEELGRFETLVKPTTRIPSYISLLTGITDEMVQDAPTIAQVFPSFLEFAAGSVLVAHNAKFDIGFLRRTASQLGYAWPKLPVIDTLTLSRKTLDFNEVPNHKLATLAQYFHATTTPAHRSMADVEATISVLHALIERVAGFGVQTLPELVNYCNTISPERRSKAGLASKLPICNGVYCFYCAHPGQPRQILYVGKARNLKKRVSSYFTAAETRRYIDEMIKIATGIEVVICETELEAAVRELRMINAHKPRYNKVSKRQDQLNWLKLTDEHWPRVSIVRKISDDKAHYIGPFTSRLSAEQASQGVYDWLQLRQCNKPIKHFPNGCALAQLDRCLAPCLHQEIDEQYQQAVTKVLAAFDGDAEEIIKDAAQRISRLNSQLRFEEAKDATERLRAFLTAMRRWHRLTALASCPEILATEYDPKAANPGWQVHLIRYGTLAGAAVTDDIYQVEALAHNLQLNGQSVLAAPHNQPGGSVAEAEMLATWLERPGVRLIELAGQWAWPAKITDAEKNLAARLGLAKLGNESAELG